MNKLVIFSHCMALVAVAACGSSNSTGDMTGGLGGSGGSGGSNAAPLGAIALPNASGAGNGPLRASDLEGVANAVDEIAAGLDNGTLAAPSTAPAGMASLTGYVGIDGDGNTDSIVGNLTIEANFDAGTVSATADGFGEFDFADRDKPVAISNLGITGGRLMGAGTITGTTMTSTLDGTVTTSSGNFTIDADLDGGFFDNDGTLLGTGIITGTSTSALGTESLNDGIYAVSE